MTDKPPRQDEIAIETRKWAFDVLVHRNAVDSVASLISDAETVAEWALGVRRSVDAFAGNGEGITKPGLPGAANVFSLGGSQQIDDAQERPFTGGGDVGHDTASVTGLDNRNEAQEPAAVMVAGSEGAA